MPAGHMIRRLCTARETKLQLALSLARCAQKAEEPKITFIAAPGSYRVPAGFRPGSASSREWRVRAIRRPPPPRGVFRGSSLHMWTIQP
ncbi:hypothetical protein GCM10010361_68340 [Streptomyces olivaceiscleroticus]|uniref:Uncharacterized protein n=1 Tax=Streptomyces olivaceiscleroticus TaxID=68245 RepID=A0ABN1BAA3_9ACTN